MMFSKLSLAICVLALTAGFAVAQNVSIVYPVDGAAYPISDPAPGSLSSTYFTASFSVTCEGDHQVEWGFDGAAVGQALFYDMISAQQVWKLPGGKHEFFVNAGRCRGDSVVFAIGN